MRRATEDRSQLPPIARSAALPILMYLVADFNGCNDRAAELLGGSVNDIG